jgi:hypothetical protein
MGPSLLHVRETFFCGSRLCVDYKERWAALLASTVKPMLKGKSLFGIFFGDEICERAPASTSSISLRLPSFNSNVDPVSFHCF